MTSTKKGKYPHNKAVVYLSVVTAVMSVAIAFLLLDTPILLLSYFATTSIITVTAFALKSLLLTRVQKASETDDQYVKNTKWQTLIFVFFMLFAFLILPLFLAGFLDPYVWFIFMIGLTSGFSVAEMLLYLQMR